MIKHKKSLHAVLAANTQTIAAARIENIAHGELFLVGPDGTFVATADADEVESAALIYGTAPDAQGRSRMLQLTPQLKPSDVRSYKGTLYDAPALETWHVGYNGTNGNFAVADDTQYSLYVGAIEKRSPYAGYNTKEFLSATSAKTGATAVDVLTELAAIAGRKNSLDFATVVPIWDGTLSAFTGNVAVTNGSRKITVAVDVLANVPKGTVLVLDGYLYRVASATLAGTNTHIVLDYDYVGATGTVLAAGAGTVSTTTNLGLEIKARDRVFDRVRYPEYTQTRLEVGNISGFDAAPFRKTVPAKVGVGDARLVAEREYRHSYNFGQTNYTQFPVIGPESMVDMKRCYNIVDISWASKTYGHDSSEIVGENLLTLYIPQFVDTAAEIGTIVMPLLNAFFFANAGKGVELTGSGWTA